MKYDIKDIKLADKGKLKIEWAKRQMPVLGLIAKRFAKEKPLAGVRIGACLHVTSETASLMEALQAGGAEIGLCASNPLSTQDEVAASLAKHLGIPVFAKKGEDRKTYYKHIEAVLAIKPNITMDDGADLVSKLHKLKIENAKLRKWEIFGSSEETTTGVIRLKAMEKDGALKIPVVAVNDSRTKFMFDNRYGTGQSTIDGILRATNILLAGKKFVVCGYGWCGRGVAWRARGMGAQVIVTEVDPIKALEAVMDGFSVMPGSEAAKTADIMVTATGNKNVVAKKHFLLMKDGVILANSGHFNVEIDVESLEKMAVKKRKIRDYIEEYEIKLKTHPDLFGTKLKSRKIYLLAEGRLVNLVAGEGHPSEVMDMSFSNQALAAEWLVKNKARLEAKVYKLPEQIDREIARLKIEAMGIKIDRLSEEQKKYLNSWSEGT